MMSENSLLEDYLALPWHYSVAPSVWEGEAGYWACVCELPDCSTFAPTQEEALLAVAQSLPAYLAAALESKAEIPTPEKLGSAVDDLGGTIVLRLPKSLHLGLKNAALKENTSVNQFALYALTKAVCLANSPRYSAGVNETSKLISKSAPKIAKSSQKKKIKNLD
jgi:antitoxin HicB